jgi:hypothetical protein
VWPANNTTYLVNNEFVPFAKPVVLPNDPNEVKLAPRGQINPQADEAIAEAITAMEKPLADLEKDLADGRHINQYDKITGQAMLARLYALRGLRMSMEAAEHRLQVADQADLVEQAGVIMSGLGKRIANYDQLLSITDETLVKLIDETKARVKELADQIGAIDSKIVELEKEKAGLAADNVKLLVEAGKVDLESKTTDAVSGVDLFDKARGLMDTAGKNSARIAQIEEAVSVLKARRQDPDTAKTAEEAKLAQAVGIDEKRQARIKNLQAERADVIKQLTETQKQAEQSATLAVAAAKAAAAADDKAHADYSKAVDIYQAYDAATEALAGDDKSPSFLKPDPAVIAMLGDTRMARAGMKVRALLLQRRLDEVASQTAAEWARLPVQNTVPPVIGQVDDYLSDASKIKEDAQDDFRWAAKVYDKAARIVPDKKLKWAYVLQQTAANVNLYRLSGDPTVKQAALDALASLGEQERSPNIFEAVGEFRTQLNNPPLLAPAAAPATTPE